MKKEKAGFTRFSWRLFTLIRFAVCFAAFWFSEYFRDIDAVLYPRVFILILSMLLGPATCAGCLPPKTQDGAALRQYSGFILYAAWWGLVAILSRTCIRLGMFT